MMGVLSEKQMEGSQGDGVRLDEADHRTVNSSLRQLNFYRIEKDSFNMFLDFQNQDELVGGLPRARTRSLTQVRADSGGEIIVGEHVRLRWTLVNSSGEGNWMFLLSSRSLLQF